MRWLRRRLRTVRDVITESVRRRGSTGNVSGAVAGLIEGGEGHGGRKGGEEKGAELDHFGSG